MVWIRIQPIPEFKGLTAANPMFPIQLATQSAIEENHLRRSPLRPIIKLFVFNIIRCWHTGHETIMGP